MIKVKNTLLQPRFTYKYGITIYILWKLKQTKSDETIHSIAQDSLERINTINSHIAQWSTKSSIAPATEDTTEICSTGIALAFRKYAVYVIYYLISVNTIIFTWTSKEKQL